MHLKISDNRFQMQIAETQVTDTKTTSPNSTTQTTPQIRSDQLQ